MDSFGEKLFSKKQEYEKFYTKYCDLKEALKNNYGDEKERQRKLDLLQYQVKELNRQV